MDATPALPVRPRILHLFRAPVGGLFRHVLDLAAGQVERGCEVGLICDAQTGGERAEAALARAIAEMLDAGDAALAESAAVLRAIVAEGFSLQRMVDGVLSAYADASMARVGRALRPTGEAALSKS